MKHKTRGRSPLITAIYYWKAADVVVSLASEIFPRIPKSTAVHGPLLQDTSAELAIASHQCQLLLRYVVDGAVRMLKYAQRSEFHGVWPSSPMFRARSEHLAWIQKAVVFLSLSCMLNLPSRVIPSALYNSIHLDAPRSKSPTFIWSIPHRLRLPIKMIKVFQMALVGMLATAVTSTPIKHKRQDGQQVIFRTDLKQGEGQSPEFKNVFCKHKDMISLSKDSNTNPKHSNTHRNKHHRPIRHHLRRRRRKSQRRPRHRRVPRHPPRHQRQHDPLHEHGHRPHEPQGPPTCHARPEAAERRLVLYCGRGAEERE